LQISSIFLSEYFLIGSSTRDDIFGRTISELGKYAPMQRELELLGQDLVYGRSERTGGEFLFMGKFFSSDKTTQKAFPKQGMPFYHDRLN
jgi:hypothetical protein